MPIEMLPRTGVKASFKRGETIGVVSIMSRDMIGGVGDISNRGETVPTSSSSSLGTIIEATAAGEPVKML